MTALELVQPMDLVMGEEREKGWACPWVVALLAGRLENLEEDWDALKGEERDVGMGVW
jgi:hypothetical protein